jgi:hypothetical protein
MNEKGLSMIEASKYVKKNGLYWFWKILLVKYNYKYLVLSIYNIYAYW